MAGALQVLLATVTGAPGTINPALPNGSGISPATWILNNDGTVTISGSSGNWVTPATAQIAALYQIKVDVTSGSFFSSDTLGSYVDLSSGWGAAEVSGTTIFTVTIREKASQTVRSTQAGLSLTGT
jgi:hypothetical protein